MPKKMTSAELAELQGKGAKVIREPRQVEVQGMDSIMKGFKELVDSINETANSRNKEILCAIDKLTETICSKSMGGTDVSVDLTPIADMITRMNEPVQKIPYEFNVDRDHRGLLSKITATPITKITLDS